ncbi:strn, partial [Symbiodinium sp. CCMP2456]
GAGVREAVEAGFDRSSLSADAKAAPEVLAAYLERLPKVRAQSCRETLRQRLQEARIDLEWPGEGGSSSSSAPATSGTGSLPQDIASGHTLEGLYALPTWQHRWTMQSHLDGVRCVFLDDKNSLLVSCGEDVVVKCWDLSSIWQMPDADELEPYAALRGHSAPVFTLAFRPQDRTLFSAGMDSTIRAWLLPESGEGILRRGELIGHTDAVWSLQHHAHLPYLATASSDGLVGLWSAEADALTRGGCRMQASLMLRQPGGGSSEELDVPTTVCWVPADTTRLLAGYVSSRIAVFDVRKGTQVLDLLPQGLGCDDSRGDRGGGASASAAVTSSCARNFGQLMATGHVDGQARLIDLSSGRFVGELPEHPDVVTSVSLDHTKAQLITGCHDGVLRTFDLRNQRCCQQLHLHDL